MPSPTKRPHRMEESSLSFESIPEYQPPTSFCKNLEIQEKPKQNTKPHPILAAIKNRFGFEINESFKCYYSLVCLLFLLNLAYFCSNIPLVILHIRDTPSMVCPMLASMFYLWLWWNAITAKKSQNLKKQKFVVLGMKILVICSIPLLGALIIESGFNHPVTLISGLVILTVLPVVMYREARNIESMLERKSLIGQNEDGNSTQVSVESLEV